MSNETTTKTCTGCAHWKATGTDAGECRRSAPQLISFTVDAETKIESRFPETAGSDWCGDYEGK